MGTRAARYASLIVLVTLTLTGCGRQVARTSDGDLLATGPDQLAIAAARPDYTLGGLESTGGVDAWLKCKRIDLRGVVSAYRSDGSYYMTEHTFVVYPWSEAVQISAHEPGSDYLWRLIGTRFQRLEGNPRVDISPLAGAYQHYASALLEILTTPVRMMDDGMKLSRRPLPVQIAGQTYTAVDAEFSKRSAGWTNATYFANRQNSQVDIIWLANASRQDYLIVRGYDYTPSRCGVFMPSVVEMFHSDAEAHIGSRFATIKISN